MDKREERKNDFRDKLHHGLRSAREPWYNAIQQHNGAIGTISGFTIAILGAFSAFLGSDITLAEVLVLAAASIALFLQVFYWLRIIKRTREIEWNIYNAISDRELYDGDSEKDFIEEAKRLRNLNTKEEPLLDNLVLWSLGLMMVLIIYHAFVSVCANLLPKFFV
jgi:hypothetical protein